MLIIGAFVVAAILFGSALRPILRRVKERDLENAVPRTGIATIEALYGANPNAIDSRTKPWAIVRFEGRLLPARAANHIERLRIGSPARITYRIGKSGKVYVDSAGPTEDQK